MILSFDQGTTSTRAILFNSDGTALATHAMPHQQIYPQPGWVSHNPGEIYQNTLAVGRQALEKAGVRAQDVQAIGITNQRETLVAWDKDTGAAVCDAIVWQCRRSAEICQKIKADDFETTLRAKTGLLADPYFTATKIRWVLDNVPDAQALLRKGKLRVGTIDSYLLWRMTGGRCHVTDSTNASRTMLFNIHTLGWDTEILEYFGIPEEILPRVVRSSGIAGETDSSELGAAIPIAGIAGDQHAALFGQCCFQEGDVKNTYGTGCFLLKNTGSKPVLSAGNLLTTLAWHIGDQPVYALEGSIFNAGSAIEWLLNEMKLVKDLEEFNQICRDTPDTGGMVFVPAFSGLGAPHWDMYARGAALGMSLSTGKNQFVRAAAESVAYQTVDVLNYMEQESGLSMERLRVDGGISRSDVLMQFQADMLGLPVERPANVETTALGAAYLAGLATGVWKDLGEIAAHRQIAKVYTPELSKNQRDEKHGRWLRAVEKAKSWA